ncbi:MAG: hypothetical protein ABIG89_07280 [Candidatus Woesearchaeota archaeon]
MGYKMKPLNFIKNTSFVQSFDCDTEKFKSYLFTVMYDLIYYLVFGIILISFVRFVLPKAAFLFKAKNFVEGMQHLPFETVGVMAQEIKSSIYVFCFFAFVVLLLLLANFSLFKGLIWAKIFGKGYDYKTFLKLLLVNFAIALFFVIMFFFTAIYVKDENQTIFALLFMLPLTVHLSHTGNAVFVLMGKDKLKSSYNLGSSFSRFLRVAFAKIYLFIIPYIILLFILFIIINLVILIKFLPPKVYYFIYLLVFVCYANWGKHYLGLVVKKSM